MGKEGKEGGDLTLLDLSDRASYHLEGIGAECWRLLAAGSSVAEMMETVAGVYAVLRERVAADISALIDELCRNGLLQRDYKHIAQASRLPTNDE